MNQGWKLIALSLLVALALTQTTDTEVEVTAEVEEEFETVEAPAISELELGRMQQRITDDIVSTDIHKECTVHQGPNLTLVRCPDRFEVFQTPLLGQQTNGLVNYGSTKTIYGVNQSYETNHGQSLTYLDGTGVVEIYVAFDVVINQYRLYERIMMTLPFNPAVETMVDVFVFDMMVVGRKSNGELVFYMKPLGEGQEAQELTKESYMESDQIVEASLMLAGDFVSIKDDVVFFCLTQGQIHMYVFTLDSRNMRVIMSSNTFTDNRLDGQRMRMEAGIDILAVTCSDCNMSGTFIYDKNRLLDYISPTQNPDLRQLNELAYYQMPVLENKDWYHIALHNDDSNIGYEQVFISSNSTIDLLERQVDRHGKQFFKYTEEVFVRTDFRDVLQPGDSNEIYMGKSDNYLVFKEASDARLHIVPACSPYTFFNNETFTCDPCEAQTRSFGLQDDFCRPCLNMRVASSDDLEFALFGRICRDEGFYKSISIVVTVPGLIVLYTILQCVMCKPGQKVCYGGCSQCADEYDEMCDCCGVRKKYKLGRYSEKKVKKNTEQNTEQNQEPANDLEMAQNQNPGQQSSKDDSEEEPESESSDENEEEEAPQNAISETFKKTVNLLNNELTEEQLKQYALQVAKETLEAYDSDNTGKLTREDQQTIVSQYTEWIQAHITKRQNDDENFPQMSEKGISGFLQDELNRANQEGNDISEAELNDFFYYVLKDMHDAENSNEAQIYKAQEESE